MKPCKIISNDKNIGSLVLAPLQNLTILFKQCNSLSDETNFQDDDDDDDDDDNDDDDKLNNYKYYGLEQVQSLTDTGVKK